MYCDVDDVVPFLTYMYLPVPTVPRYRYFTNNVLYFSISQLDGPFHLIAGLT